MDVLRLIIALLTFAAFALPVLAAASTYRHARRVIDNIDARADRYAELHAEWIAAMRDQAERDGGKTPYEQRFNNEAIIEEYISKFKAEGFPAPTVDDAGSGALRVTAHTVRLIFSGNGPNAVLATLGLTCGFIAAIWSLYLP